MNTKEINENRNDHRVKFSKKSEILNANGIMMDEESKYEMFRKIRIRLGKTKEEFQNIFELYNLMRNH
jgi:hypothetical protein